MQIPVWGAIVAMRVCDCSYYNLSVTALRGYKPMGDSWYGPTGRVRVDTLTEEWLMFFDLEWNFQVRSEQTVYMCAVPLFKAYCIVLSFRVPVWSLLLWFRRRGMLSVTKCHRDRMIDVGNEPSGGGWNSAGVVTFYDCTRHVSVMVWEAMRTNWRSDGWYRDVGVPGCARIQKVNVTL